MDSVQFALAMERYDITVHQPHPPGYFLYVMLGRLLNHLIRDANTTLVSMSVAFSALTVVAVFYLGKELFDVKTGVLSAVIAITSPNFWFHGEVALSYVVEAFFSTVIAFLCWKIYRGEHKYLWFSVIILGVAGGVRQNTAVFLLPLWLFSVNGVPARKVLLSLVLLGLVCLLWFVPMIWMTGGWTAYSTAFRELWLFNTGHNSVFEKGWSSFKIFSTSLVLFTFYSIGAGIFLLTLSTYSLIRKGQLMYLDSRKVVFFYFWVMPSFFFYLLIFIHPANPGYVLIFVPALIFLVAVSAEYLTDEFKRLTKGKFMIPMALIVVIINTCIFFPSRSLVSYEEIRKHDRGLEVLLDAIGKFEASHTAVIVQPDIFFGLRHIMYYLPSFRVYQVDRRVASTGEVRKTFWGINRETFLTDAVSLPVTVDRIVIPLAGDYRNEVNGIKELTIVDIADTNLAIGCGHSSDIEKIYPELNVRYTR